MGNNGTTLPVIFWASKWEHLKKMFPSCSCIFPIISAMFPCLALMFLEKMCSLTALAVLCGKKGANFHWGLTESCLSPKRISKVIATALCPCHASSKGAIFTYVASLFIVYGMMCCMVTAWSLFQCLIPYTENNRGHLWYANISKVLQAGGLGKGEKSTCHKTWENILKPDALQAPDGEKRA